MKTTKNLATLMLMSILTAGGFLFTACSEDDELLETAPVSAVPQELGGGDDILVEAKAMKVPFTVQADGAWKIVTDDHFYVIEPSEGVGTTEVTIYTQNNTREYRKTGTFRVLETNGKTTAVKLVQKMQGEEQTMTTRASQIEKQNSVYAVGYGYDCTARYAHPDGVRCQIFNTEMLADNDYTTFTPITADLMVHTETGSTMSEITNSLSTKAEVSGGIGKFKGEAKANFDMNTANNHNCEYAINYFDAVVYGVKFETSFGQLKEKWMTDEAYQDINGLSKEYAGNDKIAKLVRDYGTHVVMSAKLGGRISQSMTIDVTDIKTSYDVKAFAQASYGGICCSGKASVEDEFKKSLEQNKKSVSTRLNVQGGSRAACNNLVMEGDFTSEHVRDWFKSLNDDNMSLMGFDSNSLIPLYMLVDEKYPERRAMLEAYLEGKNQQIYKDFDCMIQSTVTSFELQPFTNCYRKSGTLIKDICLEGQKIAILCNEYIPQLNKNQRVNVVYPIINGAPRFNMGYFLGDNGHRPGRISWNKDGMTYVENASLNFGQAKKFYISGVSVTAQAPQDATVKAGKVEDAWMRGIANVSGYNKTWEYGIVKIGKYIWTRDDYKEVLDGIYVNYGSFQTDRIKIEGWHVALDNEFKYLVNYVVENGSTLPALTMYSNSDKGAENQTGFNANFWNSNDSGRYGQWRLYPQYHLSGHKPIIGYIYDYGKVTTGSDGDTTLARVRLVMDYDNESLVLNPPVYQN